MSKHKLIWRLVAFIFAILIPFVALLLYSDYRKTENLRKQVGILTVGTPVQDVIALLGTPNSLGRGSRPNANGEMISGYSVWIYCSRFDWNGVRSRWNDAPFFQYWLSRLNPTVDNDHDAVLELWLKDGKLEVIENSVKENLLGRHPKLSL